MEKVTFKIEARIANAYKASKIEEKERINKIINQFLKEIYRKKESEDLFETLDKISEEAKTKGINYVAFQEIMELDDNTMQNIFGKEI